MVEDMRFTASKDELLRAKASIEEQLEYINKPENTENNRRLNNSIYETSSYNNGEEDDEEYDEDEE